MVYFLAECRRPRKTLAEKQEVADLLHGDHREGFSRQTPQGSAIPGKASSKTQPFETGGASRQLAGPSTKNKTQKSY